jgi:hypothetical protein
MWYVSRYDVLIHTVHTVSAYHNVLPMWSECIAHVVRVYCPCGQSASRYVVSIHAVCMVSMVSMYHNVSPYIAHRSVCLMIYCPRGQSASRYVVSIHPVCMVSMCHNILPTWSECIAICRINSSSPHGQYVSQYIAHMVRVPHAVRVHRDMLPMWSECLMIYCINSSCPHGQYVSQCITMYCPFGQCVSRYVAHMSVCRHILLLVRVPRNMLCQFMLFAWSVCLTICCINSCCSCGQYVSRYIAHMSECITICCSCGQYGQYVSQCIAHWSVCITIYCISL